MPIIIPSPPPAPAPAAAVSTSGTLWESLLNRVIPSAHGCPDTLAIDHLIQAARVFASRTLVWQYDATPIPAKAGIADYTVQIGDEQELVRILDCQVDGRTFSTPALAVGRRLVRQGVGNICATTGPHDFTLSPAPNMDGQLINMFIAVRPTLTSSGWPQDLDEHLIDIVTGALSTLLAMPRVEWRDPEQAATSAMEFQRRIGVVQMKVQRGYGRSRQGATVQWF